MSQVRLRFDEYQELRDVLARVQTSQPVWHLVANALATLEAARWRTEEEDTAPKSRLYRLGEVLSSGGYSLVSRRRR